MAQSWAYHPKLGADIFDESELKTLYANGWYDSPAKFPKNEEPVEVKRRGRK